MSSKLIATLLAVATFSLASCSSTDLVYSMVGAEPPSPQETAALTRIAKTPESTRDFLAGTTVKGFDNLHGTQIEYLGRNGLASLWYPGNFGAVPSRWTTRLDGGVTKVCFKYPTRSYNPVTGEGGGYWECRPAVEYLYLSDEIRSGDPFRLASGRVPFILPKDKDLSIAMAMKQSGSSRPVGPNKVTWAWRN